jgi:hypothetical protein
MRVPARLQLRQYKLPLRQPAVTTLAAGKLHVSATGTVRDGV